MASLTRNGRSITVPDDSVDYYIGKGWSSPELAPEGVPIEFPEGDPSMDWKLAQLTAYATIHGLELGDAKTKAELLAVITPPSS